MTSRDVTARLLPLAKAGEQKRAAGPAVVGRDGAVLALCCNPLPGELIVGVAAPGGVLTVHRADCQKAEGAKAPLDWSAPLGHLYNASVRVDAIDRPGLLRDVASVVAVEHVNMTAVCVETHPDQTATITATLMIGDVGQLSRILGRLEGLHGVSAVVREGVDV